MQLPLLHVALDVHGWPSAILDLQIAVLVSQYCAEEQLLVQVLPHPSAPLHLPLQAGVHPQTLAVPPPPQVL